MDKEGLAALDASIRNRALFYKGIFDELRAELGEAKATEILRSAIYKRGLEIGKPFARFAPDDFEGLKAAFLAFVPGGDAVFAPKVERCDKDGLSLRLAAVRCVTPGRKWACRRRRSSSSAASPAPSTRARLPRRDSRSATRRGKRGSPAAAT
jgi:hypothetical protein